ncbi:carbamoyl-phosphate synthase large subunit [Cupriavidus metallidurans]|jgi:carbamoyl-phosphate synthase large subunit|uniref:Carbamoyl phosphate synthase large chain n=1 Tax=Cupriavidus metallidurans (strain ATCC 43123 / DSM 2839 / NBRC 102507 / CH34) TaxID=266264 RepID=Q1LLA4_CUPMC|nr:carbamoyl-phosphate synthase large subunit [Cupriavidus metallidurans]ABF09072.1 carbamoyl-phosphate synthase large subunit [Cupriavidus metallidurans CH34]AVA36266.1 carbamoyl-phosphate synthase large subunit [Cupriavidus metallidurans]KWW37636.1 Carbamoyl-phosphate synthase large chain [Cupriavidus metallidurans]MDE4918624.1 carbamoyl-phosphate synthase large subunit [Cupriavidus metallidurans]QGS30039.1 carbamoyl-phosphate synthase large subunit [Cupriavidus metallidurans]
MPKRTDIKSILIIGAGPIIIGQACEFDYSGAQACKALREEGFKVILVNSNPATIMTDPNTADVTYIEPITWEVVERIIEKERPDAILPTMGGQTALNCALDLHRHGVLDKYKVELIGASPEAIDKAEDRQKFKDAMTKIGLGSAKSGIAHSMDEAVAVQSRIAQETGTAGYPIVIRPSFTLGGTGGGIAYNREEFEEICKRGLDLSPTRELLIEESLLGWKEYEMEVVRDKADNCIIICSIENLDPMGIHTGDSITVAPAQTLTDKEYQILRNASLAVLREIGVDTGGSNVQFSINPTDGRMIVIEMNPRVSRSSALASKATGFPIAKVAAKLAVGYTLDELKNEITGGQTPASFEPSIDYVVTKVPRFAFEKFPAADSHLTTQMKSVGEVMAMGRTFQESFQKALRGLEVGVDGLDEKSTDRDEVIEEIGEAGPDRIWYVGDAFRLGMSLEEVQSETDIDPWFLAQIEDIVKTEGLVRNRTLESLSTAELRHLKQKGFSDRRLAKLLKTDAKAVRLARVAQNVRPVYKRVDTCAAEFATNTAYMYGTYEAEHGECEADPTSNKKIMVLGGGPNRIGQGIEFDYCCVHAALALREDGYETIMVNCNPETVSTDYDTSDRLYFEPLTLEDVLEIVDKEKPVGVIVQYGGQTPLKLALDLEANGVPIIGTSPDMIDAAEDRERFQKLLQDLGLRQPPNRTARAEDEALRLAEEIGYPLVVRPSYVLGGRAMEIVHEPRDLERYMREAVKVSNDSPVLLDRFLNDAIECDVDALCDGTRVFIGGVMEHIEQAGVHSGDSACSLPPYSLSQATVDELKRQTAAMAKALNVVGLMNVQFAIQQRNGEDIVYVLEVNPRASRTVPYVSKATGLSLAKIAARCMAGQSLDSQGIGEEVVPPYYSVKEAVFPFNKFPGVDPVLGPEMRSTGEVMGVGKVFGEALFKSQLAAGSRLPEKGTVLITVKDSDKPRAVTVARMLHDLGYPIVATRGTASAIEAAGIPVRVVNKVKDGRPHIVDMIKNGELALVFTTVDETRTAIADSRSIRIAALAARVPYYTTIAGANAAVEGLKHMQNLEVYDLQGLHKQLA